MMANNLTLVPAPSDLIAGHWHDEEHEWVEAEGFTESNVAPEEVSIDEETLLSLYNNETGKIIHVEVTGEYLRKQVAAYYLGPKLGGDGLRVYRHNPAKTIEKALIARGSGSHIELLRLDARNLKSDCLRAYRYKITYDTHGVTPWSVDAQAVDFYF